MTNGPAPRPPVAADAGVPCRDRRDGTAPDTASVSDGTWRGYRVDRDTAK